MPFVLRNQIYYTFDGYKLYLGLVLHLSKARAEDIDKDNPNLLKMILDNIVVFEIHWRKMVVDIREGKLNRRLPIDSSSREVIESHLLPNEENATRLDSLLRDLGFHKKVIGKDMPSIQLALRKEIQSFSDSDHFNGYSMDSSTFSLEDSSVSKKSDQQQEFLPSPLISGKSFDNCSSYSTTLSKYTPSVKNSKPIIERSLSPLKLDCGKFACPYAGCGMTFNSKVSSLTHIFEHENQKVSTVKVAAPRTDAHYECFWPKDATWVPRFKNSVDKRLLPPDTIFCAEKNCNAHFINNHQFFLHTKTKHPNSKLNRMFKGDYFTLSDTVDPPPLETLGLFICKEHVDKPSRRCRACQEIEDKNFPKPPYIFYETVSINFPANEETEMSITERYISYSRSNIVKGAEFISKRGKSIKAIRGICREFILDRNKKCWVYIQELLLYEEAIKGRVHLPHDFDTVNELFPLAHSFVWMPLDLAVRDFCIEYCAKSEFKLLFSKNSESIQYFIRPDHRFMLR